MLPLVKMIILEGASSTLSLLCWLNVRKLLLREISFLLVREYLFLEEGFSKMRSVMVYLITKQLKYPHAGSSKDEMYVFWRSDS